jgi:hypothetical protein
MNKLIGLISTLAILASASAYASSFPIDFSVTGGIGAGYYAMDGLNRHLGITAQSENVTIDRIESDVNCRIEGRLWLMNCIALCGGYEHFWAATDAQDTSTVLSYRAPADVYTVGAIYSAYSVENVVDLCVGTNVCFVSSVFGTNEAVERRFSEYEGDDVGYEIYAETHTNFLKPIEVGFQLGYRGLKIDAFENRYGNVSYFEEGGKMVVDYSGVFFYLLASIRI